MFSKFIDMTETGRVWGIIYFIEKPETKVVLSGCAGQKCLCSYYVKHCPAKQVDTVSKKTVLMF